MFKDRKQEKKGKMYYKMFDTMSKYEYNSTFNIAAGFVEIIYIALINFFLYFFTDIIFP